MEKSYVSLESKICPVCGIEFETNSILMDTTGQNSLERKTTTGYALCDKHRQEFEDGYLHLVVADTEGDSKETHIKMEDAIRTGEIISVKRSVLKSVLNRDIDDRIPFVYIEPEAANTLKRLAGITEDEPPKES